MLAEEALDMLFHPTELALREEGDDIKKLPAFGGLKGLGVAGVDF